MGYELMRAATTLQRVVMSAPSSKARKTQKRALALVGKSNCRSLYKLQKMNFVGFTPQQSAAVAAKLLDRSTKWFGGVKSKVPTIGTYIEMRFFVKSFLKIADDAGAMRLYRRFAKQVYLPSNPSAKQIKGAIKSITTTLKMMKRLLPPAYTSYSSSIDKLASFLDALSKSNYLVQGWVWLTVSDGFIKGNLSYCK